MTTETAVRTPPHQHEWERGLHIAEAFGVDGRTYACAVCGTPRPKAENADDTRLRKDCVCGQNVLVENWDNHLLTSTPRGPHAEFQPVDVLSDEEARVLQRLDLLEADDEAMQTRGGKLLHTRLENVIAGFATRVDAS